MKNTGIILIKIGQSYREGMSEEDLYKKTSVSWKLSKEKLESGNYKYYCAVYKNKIKEVYEMTGFEEDPVSNKNGKYRYILKGKVAKEKIRNELLDLNVKDIHKGAGNPIKYSSVEELLNFTEKKKHIAEPFSSVFNTFENADWAFDFVLDSLEKLGITEPDDQRLVVTSPVAKKERAIHINFCDWLLLGFYNDANEGLIVRLPLIKEEAPDKYRSEYFAQKGEETEIASCLVPLEDLRPMQEEIKRVYDKSFTIIKEKFARYSRSRYKRHHLKKLENAIFYPNQRKEIFSKGVRLDEPPSDPEKEKRFFWLTANPSIWSVERLRDGGVILYTAYNEKGNKRRLFSAFQSAQPGDEIIFYESTPRKEVVATGEVVEGLHLAEEDGFENPVEGVSFRLIEEITPISWETLSKVDELQQSSPVSNGAQGSLFELTKQEFEAILSLEEPETVENYTEIPSISFEQETLASNLYFEEKEMLFRQVKTALQNGKHIILTGPPGTGKSKLAKEICTSFGAEYQMATATSDWSTYETIGGYMPKNDGTLSFNPGLFLSCFKDYHTNKPINKWLIIDEMNRADIDKAFGALFSALTGDPITLNFYTERNQSLLLRPQKEVKKIIPTEYEFVIPNDWRLIGTINTLDKASLYEMSYAFMRRFAFIQVGVPKQITKETIDVFLSKWNISDYGYKESLAFIWNQINEFRLIGPAIIEDLARYTSMDEDFTSAIILYVLPQFEGLLENQITEFIDRLGQIEEVDTGRLKNFATDFFHI